LLIAETNDDKDLAKAKIIDLKLIKGCDVEEKLTN
jgi:hypothetical protein